MLPKQWSDISLEQFIEISDIEKSLGSSHYNAEIISILTENNWNLGQQDNLIQLARFIEEAHGIV